MEPHIRPLRKNVRDYALFMLGIFTGRRISDLVALNVEDVAQIDKRGRFAIKTRLQIREHKTGKYTDIILHPAARRALSKYLHKRKRESTWAYLLREPLFKSQKPRANGELRITKHYVWWILTSAAIQDRYAHIEENFWVYALSKWHEHRSDSKGVQSFKPRDNVGIHRYHARRFRRGYFRDRLACSSFGKNHG